MTLPTSEQTPSVVITGASTGIGEACALEMDRRNWRVFAGVRSAEAGERLRQRASNRLVPLLIDVTNREQIAAAAKTVTEAVGSAGLNGLVNNAGVVVAGPIELIPLEDLRKEFEVNVVGQVAVTQAFLPQLRAARGRIVLMSSVSGKVAAPYLGPYAASKHALEAIGDSLRVELHRWGISVSVIEPGSIRTPIWDKARAEADQLAQRMPPEAEALYGEELEQMRRATERLAASGLPVETVVRAVAHALISPRPKTRYPVGAQTKLAVSVFKFLSDRTKDWLIRRELGLS